MVNIHLAGKTRSKGVLERKWLFNIWISNVPKTGEVNALKIKAVNKLNFEPIFSARSGRRSKFRLSSGRLNFELSPTSGGNGNGPKVQPVKTQRNPTCKIRKVRKSSNKKEPGSVPARSGGRVATGQFWNP